MQDTATMTTDIVKLLLERGKVDKAFELPDLIVQIGASLNKLQGTVASVERTGDFSALAVDSRMASQSVPTPPAAKRSATPIKARASKANPTREIRRDPDADSETETETVAVAEIEASQLKEDEQADAMDAVADVMPTPTHGFRDPAGIRRADGSVMTALEQGKQPAVPPRKSVTHDFLVCLEDGKKLKMLKRWLTSSYGLTPDEYKARWGLPEQYPMVCAGYSASKRDYAMQMNLGKPGMRGIMTEEKWKAKQSHTSPR